MMRYFCIGTIAKDEPDIAEWVAYHLFIGAQHILIYDNGSRIPIAQTLRGFIGAGLVTVVQLDASKNMQGWVNQQLIARGRSDFACRWMGAIDVDEFILPMDGVEATTGQDAMLGILSRYQPAGLVLNWAMFGSNGHWQRPKDLIISAYRKRDVNLHALVKTIFDPNRVLANCDAHYFHYAPREAPVNVRGEVRYGSVNVPPLNEVARINHYFVKSREDWDLKVARGSSDHTAPKTKQVIQDHEDACNGQQDDLICRFIPGVQRYLDAYGR